MIDELILQRQHEKVIYRNNVRQRIGCQADKINFQQNITHFPTKLVTIVTFIAHEKWQIPHIPSRNHVACAQKRKTKQDTTLRATKEKLKHTTLKYTIYLFNTSIEFVIVNTKCHKIFKIFIYL